jgi:hypothetical protein
MVLPGTIDVGNTKLGEGRVNPHLSIMEQSEEEDADFLRELAQLDSDPIEWDHMGASTASSDEGESTSNLTPVCQTHEVVNVRQNMKWNSEKTLAR